MQMPQPGRHRGEPWDKPSDPNLVLWRYMDLARFVSLLKTKQLFFSRADSLQDRFEGSLTKSNYEMRARVGAVGGSQRRLRERVYVNCWFAQNQQSTAMWNIYGGSASSVAIRTTYGKLIAVLPEQTPIGSPNVGLIDYIDRAAEGSPYPSDWRNEFQPFFQKNIEYSYEHELRIMIAKLYVEVETDPNIYLPKDVKIISETGLVCPITSFIDLIDMVYVNFEAKKWFWDVVNGSPSISFPLLG